MMCSAEDEMTPVTLESSELISECLSVQQLIIRSGIFQTPQLAETENYYTQVLSGLQRRGGNLEVRPVRRVW